MKKDLDTGIKKPGPQSPRQSARVRISATVKLHRRDSESLGVKVFDLSPEGCKVEFLEPPRLDETVWLKFDGLELLQATVCWIEDRCVGVEFARPLHRAVFEMLAARFR